MTVEPTDPEIEARWRQRLTEGHRPLRVARAIFKHLPTEPRCKLCHNPFGGVGGKLVGLFGYRPSRKNPNLCQQCCDTLPPGGAEIELAVLFADIRGSTELGERMASTDYASLLNRYYLVATRVLVHHDGIVDKLIGDEVMALFIPGISGEQYRRRAAEAAYDLLTQVSDVSGDGPGLPIGIGVHAGRAFAGNVGAGTVVDFTALGDAVNTTARLQGAARAGELLISESIYAEVRERFPDLERRELALQGKEERVVARVLRA